MNRNPAALTDRPLDVLVVGGGIAGACVAWDAAARGLSTALIDRGDFASGTSANSLRIIHGGLRHLQRLDLAESRMAIGERSAWLRMAPHLVEPLPVLVPTRGALSIGLLRSALMLNDLVAFDRNRELPTARRIPGGRLISRAHCLEVAPVLHDTAGNGGVMFSDAQVYSSERLVLEVVEAAVKAGAIAVNYVELDAALVQHGQVVGARVRDVIGDTAMDVRTRTVVNAAGPAMPAIAGRLLGRASKAATPYSVALNLVVPALGPSVALALDRPGSSREVREGGGRRLLFVPWRGRSLIGTGHYPYRGDVEGFQVSEEYVASFLQAANTAWPGPPIRIEDVLHVHAGLLPATSDDTAGVDLIRRHAIVDHGEEGLAGALSVRTVKYTTARRVAEETVDRVFHRLRKEPPECRTSTARLPGAPSEPIDRFIQAALAKHSDAPNHDVLEHLVRSYGVRYEAVLEAVPGESLRRVEPDEVVAFGQFVHGVRAEMAVTAEDLVWRRTELGPRGSVSDQAIELARRALGSVQSSTKPAVRNYQ